MEKTFHLLYEYLLNIGIPEHLAKFLNMITLFILFLVVVILIYYAIKRIILNIAKRLSRDLESNFDDILIKNHAVRNISYIFPVLIAAEFVPFIFIDYPSFERIAIKAIYIFSIILTLWIIKSVLNTFKDYFKSLPHIKDKPVDSYVQVFMIVSWFIGIMFAFLIITNKSFWQFFTALGAISAITMLVFKDTIMGFVASIQVSINDIVRIGDWVTFKDYGADGYVLEINLATVKIQNFDKTITTIPTYALVSNSFKNWRGMENSGGRRFNRAIIIKQSTIKYLVPEDVEKLEGIELISEYVKNEQEKNTKYNEEHMVDTSHLLNGKHLTNIGVFRKYLESYLENHSAINKEMLIMVRQLDPTSEGIPMELYAFSKDKRWKNYEYIVSDIFDHMLASVKYFDLEIYERASDTRKNNPTPRVTI